MDDPFSTYVKFSEKHISFSLICTRTCVYQGVRDVSFSENLRTYSMHDPKGTNQRGLKLRNAYQCKIF